MKDIFLVDADDTILDFHGVAQKAVRYAFESIGLDWKDEYASIYATLNAKLWEALERKEITRTELMDTRFSRFLAHIGYVDKDGDACNRAYIQYLSSNPAYLDGAQEFLLELKKRGRIYIVTNGTSYIQKERFAICNLSQYVDGIFVSEEVGFDKPAKEFSDFVYANIPRFEKSRAIWIGDSLSADIQCAVRSNADSIWFNPHGKTASEKIKPSYTASCFAEILDILDRI